MVPSRYKPDSFILPHEEVLSSRQASTRQIRTADAEKDDISVRALDTCAVRSSTQKTTSSLYSPQTCPICCEDYEVGDDIAWSKNEECHHAYHVECILEWLMDNKDCPMCRSNFLTANG